MSKTKYISIKIFHCNFFYISLFAVLACLIPTQAFAVCTPSPDYWFEFTVNIDQQSLPPGVTMDRNTRYHGTQLYPMNSTNVPLIINPPNPGKEPDFRFPTVKLVSGQEFECTGPAQSMTCDKSVVLNTPDAMLTVPEVYNAIMTGWILKDDRPKDVEIPKPQAFQFNTLYGDKVVPITGTVTFALHTRYNPKLGVITDAYCQSQNAQSSGDQKPK